MTIKEHWIDYVSSQHPKILLTMTFRNLKKYQNADIATKTINEILYLTNSKPKKIGNASIGKHVPSYSVSADSSSLHMKK